MIFQGVIQPFQRIEFMMEDTLSHQLKTKEENPITSFCFP
jgi:hypothetical protein